MSRREVGLRGQSETSNAANGGKDVETHASNLLAKGRLLLEALTLKAEAARAEAEKAHLEILLEKAEVGDCEPLQAWVEDRSSERIEGPGALGHPGERLGRLSASESVGGAPDSESAKRSEPAEREAPGAGWQSEQGRAWIAASRARLGLAEDARAAPATKARASKTSAAQKADEPGGSNARLRQHVSREKSQETKSPSDKSQANGKIAASAKSAAAQSEKVCVKPSGSAAEPRASKEVLSAVSGVLGEEQSESPGASRSRLAGIAASVIVHVLLLVLLAVITLKLPPDTAGLDFQSAASDTSDPVMEVVQEVSAEVPESQDAESVSEPVVDASDSLSDIQADLSDSLGQIQTDTPASSASSIMSATSAASSNLPSGEAASFFGAAAGGNNFCYVIDASGSMRGGPWQAAKFELLKSLASLKANQRYYIVCFNRDLSPMVLDGPGPEPSSVYATPENLQKTRRWIETIAIGIGAPPNKALEYAIELEPDAIYFLSDGVTKVDVAAFLREINQVESLFGDSQVRVPIHPIAYYSLEGQALLRQIAAENRGQFIYVPDPTK